MTPSGSRARTIVSIAFLLALLACGARQIPREDWGGITRDAEIRVTTLDGVRHELTEVVVLTDRLEGIALAGAGEVVRLPLDSVEFVESMSGSGVLPVLTALAAVATTIMIIDAMGKSDIEPPPTEVGSCPFIYSFDGEGYRLDSETFAGAITRGLTRTDLDNLEHLRAVDGLYRLRLTNERPETQHTDELTLRVVDHAAGTEVYPDVEGRLHVLADARAPLGATGLRGADVLADVAVRDDRFWLGDPVLDIDVDDPSSFRDGMEVTFPRPDGDRALLAVRSQNTPLAPFALERFLELFGDGLVAWYRRVDHEPALQAELRAWIEREGMLHVSVWKDGGWVRQGALLDVGPHVPKTQVARLDLAGVESDRVRIRLEGPRGLWTVDHVALGLESESTPVVHDLLPVEAVDGRGRDVLAELSATDDAYLTALPGLEVELAYRAPPPQAAGLERSVMARTRGFYHIWIEQTGEPRLDIVARILTEPLFINRYVLGLLRGTSQ